MNFTEAFNYIQNSYENGRMSQAYVIKAPPRGSGHELACRIIGLLFDEHAVEMACEGRHPDVHWVEPEKKSRVIGVDSMRAILKAVHETSYEGGWKVCVFVGADCMMAPAANAFLKTLEEPPAKTLFLLLTDSPQFLLPTIISRCQQVTISEGNTDGLEPELRAEVADILSAATGSPVMDGLARAERMVALLREENKRIKEEESELWHDERVALGMDEKDIKKSDDALDARVSSRYRELRQAVMRSILLWYRDVLLLVCGADDGLLFHRESLDVLRRLAEGTSYREALAKVKLVEEMNAKLGRNMPEILVFSDGFMV